LYGRLAAEKEPFLVVRFLDRSVEKVSLTDAGNSLLMHFEDDK
jgi:hypothetical protein